jgi:hypothetical protein
MKKCPTCEKTFEDSMRFCQSDGTPLVAVAETIDPYKTMVARPDEIAAAIPAQRAETPAAKTPNPPLEEDVLQIPKAADPNKTMFASEEEIRKEMAADAKSEEPVIEIPPASETPAPPAFIDADLNPVRVPPPVTSAPEPPVGNLTSPPIPSPFGSSGKSAADVSPMVPQYREREPKPEPPPSVPSFDESPLGSPFEAQPTATSPFQAQTPSSPFDDPSANTSFDEPPVIQPMASTPPDQQMAQAEWTPPPVPESSWQPEGGQGPQPPAAAGQSSTLAIISLVVGILSLCCGYIFIPGIAAIVLGFMARGKASKDPAHYGGSGLALGGIICGVLSIFLGIILIVLYLFGFAAAIMNR